MLGVLYRKKIWQALRDSDVLINVHDVGSAGSRQYYFADRGDRIKFTDFEANSNGKLRALGSTNMEGNLFVTENDHMSSLYKPNIDYLQERFDTKHWRDRRVSRVVETLVDKLDDLFDYNSTLDFLKIDTQGSEFEILSGAKKVISQQKPLIYCECWLQNVYQNAPQVDQVLALSSELGYEVCALDIGADWDLKHGTSLPGRKLPVGVDLLLIPKVVEDKPLERIISLVALLEIMGLYQLAYTYSNKYGDSHPFFSQQIKRIHNLPSRRTIKFLDMFARGIFKKYKLVPKLYE